ncbi:Chromate resistance protein ChrB [Brachybacterium sp. P6-10-X1]|uniref:Chromate resistance protein ChrB n=1 Tax=Brachybacterium sp. P6-10-X1 TaxID=1903186 RepID=UPI001C12C364|nr:Chromate resistance protein ChrB [Brachybacterium sp. P6-10-X1]
MDDPWLLVSVSTAGAPDSLRVHAWRKLRSLGALYLQQGACLLPAQQSVARETRRLADRVHRDGGAIRVLRMEFVDNAEERSVIEEFNAARDAEYAEVLERIPGLHEELATERDRGNITYAEVEESEADLERFRSWLGKIDARDHFDAPLGRETREAVDKAAADLEAFEESALRADASAGADAAQSLRSLSGRREAAES